MSNPHTTSEAPRQRRAYAEIARELLSAGEKTARDSTGAHPGGEQGKDQHEAPFEAVPRRSSKRGHKRPRTESRSPSRESLSKGRVSPFNDAVAQDIPGPENMMDTEEDFSATLHKEERPSRENASAAPSSAERATTAQDLSNTNGEHTSPTPISEPAARENNNAAHGAFSQSSDAAPSTSASDPPSSSRTGTAAGAQGANPTSTPDTTRKDHNAPPPADPISLPRVDPGHQAPPQPAAEPTAHTSAEEQDSAPQATVGQWYSPFDGIPAFAGLPKASMKMLKIDRKSARILRPSSTQVVKNVTADCIKALNALDGPKALVWAHGFGHRQNPLPVVNEITTHIRLLTPGDLADNVTVAPLHQDHAEADREKPYYYAVTDIPEEVLEVFIKEQTIHCEDGYTFSMCPYNPPIEGERFFAAYNRLTCGADKADEVADAFARHVRASAEARTIINEHCDAIPEEHRSSEKSRLAYLASTIRADPIPKGDGLVWRLYMATPTHDARAFDNLVHSLHGRALFTARYSLGRYFKIWPCSICRAIDHSKDGCPGPSGKIPGWRDSTLQPSNHGTTSNIPPTATQPANNRALLPVPTSRHDRDDDSDGESRSDAPPNRRRDRDREREHFTPGPERDWSHRGKHRYQPYDREAHRSSPP
ncbi:hypothetical protein K523DRAFT_361925 [Schizophyllum commune Tattone D]|nr:hypothetical protein K523DRAFT_361925 [Schizophyllum commune Tattone D]